MELKLAPRCSPQAELFALLERQPTRPRRPRGWLGRPYRQPGRGILGAALRDVDLFADLLEREPPGPKAQGHRSLFGR